MYKDNHRTLEKNVCGKKCMLICLTKTFALVGGSIHEDLGGDDCTKWKEHLHELVVTKFLR